ncbi:MAG: hypothetical protein AB1806_09995 [Acidobacteriota bacterium]
MTNIIRRVMAVTLPLLVVSIAVGREGLQDSPDQYRGKEQPLQWVSFSADVRTVVADGSETVGRFYRAADGSTRFEATHGDETQIIINNFSQGTHYRLFRSPAVGGTWTRQPLALPPGGVRPPMPKNEERPPDALPEQVSGHWVVRKVERNGAIRLIAPSLNGFALVEDVPGSRRTEYTQVEIGDPDPRLFEPPAGEPVKVLSTPGGIRFTPRQR